METQSKKERIVDLSKFKNFVRVDGLNLKLLPSEKEKGKSIITYQDEQCSTSSCMSLDVMPMQEKQSPLLLLNNPTTTHHNHQRNPKKRQRSSRNLAIVVYTPPQPPPQLTPRLIERIKGLGGYDPKFVIHKKVTVSDLNHQQARFTMPENNCVKGVLDHLGIHDVGVIVIVPNINLDIIMLNFTKWTTNKTYILNGSWNDFVKRNYDIIKVEDEVQVWIFRVSPSSSYHVAYGFAIVNLRLPC